MSLLLAFRGLADLNWRKVNLKNVCWPSLLNRHLYSGLYLLKKTTEIPYQRYHTVDLVYYYLVNIGSRKGRVRGGGRIDDV